MKRLLVLSGKGGTGKTTVTTVLARLSGAEALADCDVDAPNLHLALRQTVIPEKRDFLGGNKAKVNPDLCTGCEICTKSCRFDAIRIKDGKAYVNDISCEGCGVCEYLCPHKAVSLQEDVAGRLFLYKGDAIFSTAALKMGRGNSGKLVTEVKFALFDSAGDRPFAIADGSPGIGCPVIASVTGMDVVLVVAEPSESGLSDLVRLYKTVSNMGARLCVCVNKWDISPGVTRRVEKFCTDNAIPFVGRIPFDKTLSLLSEADEPLTESPGHGIEALREVWNNVRQVVGI